MFDSDPALDARARDTLARLPRGALDQNIKRYMWAAGFDMDLAQPDLTTYDRAVLAVEMQRRSFRSTDRTDLEQFAFQLWKNLDYRKAAERIDDRQALLARNSADQQPVDSAHMPAAPPPGAAVFGWPSFVRFVVLDVSRIKEDATRIKVLAAVRGCVGCYEIRTDQSKTLYGIRISSEPVEIERALRKTSLRLSYIWSNTPPPRLTLVLTDS